MSDKLVKKLYVASEYWEAMAWIRPTNPDELDEITFSYAYEQGGCEWECSIELVSLGGKAACRLKVFDDAWEMFAQAPEILVVLGNFQKDSGNDSSKTWNDLIAALGAAGWKKQAPEKRERRAKKTCHACGKAKD